MITLYIIPGFGESTKDIGYKKIINYAKEKGYIVVPFNPEWKRKTIKDWLKSFNDIITKDENSKIVVGFSFGAYIAVLSSVNNNFKKLILCSLSPYFKNDIALLPKIAHKMLGKKRIQDFSCIDFPSNIDTPAVFFVGDKDIDLVIQRVKKSHKEWSGIKKLEILSGVGHDINNDKYIKSIESNL